MAQVRTATGWTTVTTAAGDKLGLTPTAAKTTNYTAAAGDEVTCQPVTTMTVTLPTAPPDGSVVLVRLRGSAGSTVGVYAGGSDAMMAGTSPTPLTTNGQWALFQYQTSVTGWWQFGGFEAATTSISAFSGPTGDYDFNYYRLKDIAPATAGDDAMSRNASDARYLPALVPTAVQTAAYPAVARDLVKVNVSGSGFTVTLPSAPSNGTAVGVLVDTGHATNQVTLACGGSDHFQRSGGTTTKQANVTDQLWIGEYQSGVWLTIVDFTRSLNDSTTTHIDTSQAGLATVEVNSSQSLRMLQLDTAERWFGARLCTAATPADFTYFNGTAGMGATITFAANGQQSFDDVTANLNDYVVVAHTPGNHATNYEYCGLYQVTTQGDASNPCVLTRMNEYSSIGLNAQFTIICVSEGRTMRGVRLRTRPTAGTWTWGTTPIKFWGNRPQVDTSDAVYGVFRDRVTQAVEFNKFNTAQTTNGDSLVGDGGVLWFQGTGAQASQGRPTEQVESLVLSTGTTATGFAGWTNRQTVLAAFNAARCSVGFRVHTATLPTTAQLYNARWGFVMSIPTNSITDGAYFALAYNSVAAGSNGVNTSTFTGATGVLNVVSTFDFPTSGTITVQTGGTPATITYTGVTATTFTGCTTTAGGGVLATGGMVNFPNYVYVCRRATTNATCVDSTVAVGTPYRPFIIEFDDITGDVNFWIGTAVTYTINDANIPTGPMGVGIHILKQAGTTASLLAVSDCTYDMLNPITMTRYWP